MENTMISSDYDEFENELQVVIDNLMELVKKYLGDGEAEWFYDMELEPALDELKDKAQEVLFPQEGDDEEIIEADDDDEEENGADE